MPDEIEQLNLDLDLPSKNRRQLLPLWIKVFIWVFGALSIAGVIISGFDTPINLTIYGIRAYSSFSGTGILITFLFLFKAVIAFMLWTEKKKAVLLGIVDAYLGIAICISMILGGLFFDHFFSSGLRLELVLLIPYLVKLNRIRNEWESLPSGVN